MIVGVAASNNFWWQSIVSGFAGNPTRHLSNFDHAATPARIELTQPSQDPRRFVAQRTAGVHYPTNGDVGLML
ncbi:MAG: hypothetical protein EXQ69_10690 [Acidimicrobiia bacterium]|nr:hypothetical protein [Acidimicrobiia bacterium]